MTTTAVAAVRILGIDPGLNVSGYGVLEVRDRRLHLIEAGVIRGRDRSSLSNRLVEIHAGAVEVIEASSPIVWRSKNSILTTSDPRRRF